ncbi:TetR/AcrR family transcriptional regulator [Nitrospirillum amazonense]|uniref:TetR family transcriptional regulator n=1 Tax=Nitrospirillum amazonense TaxID=28077 RepID=A0A560K382_9PROT|nr:TetR/AcrR family transcriptional regulator [Nitrospirillum amazonense]MDG3444217.1 TetR/AcrR family transcriptional regulator [Nitrospirillum amazonense]TWB77771.1 TetR family transcriptional regulator [Nitrospirillum amazonense]
MTTAARPTPASPASTGQRGPLDHERRAQIVEAADQHFRYYGYHKTTVADLAKAIGLSTAYIYKFFSSKQAIGEAICARCLSEITAQLRVIMSEPASAAERLRRVYPTLARAGAALFFEERRLHDIVVTAVTENWHAGTTYEEELRDMVRTLVVAGREAGEFERETPLDEVCLAIEETLWPFAHPLMLEEKLDMLDTTTAAVAGLVLRSLRP